MIIFMRDGENEWHVSRVLHFVFVFVDVDIKTNQTIQTEWKLIYGQTH